MESFLFSKIKAEGPACPYRSVSYSSTSVFLVVLLKLSEDNGDKIILAVMLDHFPAISAALPTTLSTVVSVPISWPFPGATQFVVPFPLYMACSVPIYSTVACPTEVHIPYS
ncbi:hypothetical protein EDD85DRAFT_852844 [Armillaria nabsnona]|nr:hypothetical protein EDD85DRAFT_852844 [Armillaria nabsnona]